jgi:uncharacterized protein
MADNQKMNNFLEIRKSPVHGKGVFATKNIPSKHIFICNVLLIPKNEDYKGPLYEYHYPWSRTHDSICMGFGSFFNHSSMPNIRILNIDKDNLTKTFVTLRDIKKGEEIFIFYNKKADSILRK